MRCFRGNIIGGLGLLAALALAGCGRDAPDRSAGHARPTPPTRTGAVATAGHMLASQLAAARGDTAEVRAQQQAMQRQVMRDMRIPDPSRRIQPEAARNVVGRIAGVRGVVWLDRVNLIVMVDGARYRSQDMINRICRTLEPLGDTLAVVVNLQNVRAVTDAEADTLSRNCRLPPGQRAYMQPNRQIDVVDPALRKVFQAQQKPSGAGG